MIKFIPNSLTILRIILVPIFFYFVFFKEITVWNNFWAMLSFIIASITDYYDGAIARKYNVVSNFGKIMDPFADKLLVLSAFFALSQIKYSYISIYVVIIIAIREIGITILREIYIRKNIYLPANKWGKIKTVLQLTGIITCLVFEWWFLVIPKFYIIEDYFRVVANIYFIFVMIITIFSAVTYLTPKRNKK